MAHPCIHQKSLRTSVERVSSVSPACIIQNHQGCFVNITSHKVSKANGFYSSFQLGKEGPLMVLYEDCIQQRSPLQPSRSQTDHPRARHQHVYHGAEDVALIEYAHLTGRPFRVFSLDTGRLNPETYSLFNEVEKRYNIRIEYYFPNAAEVEDLVRMKGLFSFYEDGHQECCAIRKVRPLKRALRGLKAWITGQRKDQSPTRAAVPVVQVDGAFEGLDGGPGSLVKWNPLANTKGSDVWRFLRLMDVPVNSLHARGYVSIGCEPCTRAILPGQHEREGRWWWEDATAKECGLHKSPSSSDEGSAEQSGKVGGQRVASRDLFVDENVRVLLREDMESLLHQRPLQSTLIVLYAPWCPFCQAMEESYLDLAKQLAGSSIQVAKFNADGEQKIFAQQRLGMKSYPTIVFFSKAGSSFTKYNSEQRDKKSLLTFVDALK